MKIDMPCRNEKYLNLSAFSDIPVSVFLIKTKIVSFSGLFTNNKQHSSKNEVILQSGLFKIEVGPGMLKSNVEQTCLLQEYQGHKANTIEGIGFRLKFSCRTRSCRQDIIRSKIV